MTEPLEVGDQIVHEGALCEVVDIETFTAKGKLHTKVILKDLTTGMFPWFIKEGEVKKELTR